MTSAARAAAYALAEDFLEDGASRVDVQIEAGRPRPRVLLFGAPARPVAEAEAIVDALGGVITEHVESVSLWLEAVVTFRAEDVELTIFYTRPEGTV